ncbi:hypothetical protein HIM_10352 [Hirsutella minnesotensis 3608]|uniref:Uncharacterized protein n=1 Tax=Hirsutella minnesotensis 3608 TaxID=1043627 RepID=A0A0F7ZG49_9HYPO|nr:hypothetical protein HIM_10352 [Hirsutella minnesotensis 3608]
MKLIFALKSLLAVMVVASPLHPRHEQEMVEVVYKRQNIADKTSHVELLHAENLEGRTVRAATSPVKEENIIAVDKRNNKAATSPVKEENIITVDKRNNRAATSPVKEENIMAVDKRQTEH